MARLDISDNILSRRGVRAECRGLEGGGGLVGLVRLLGHEHDAAVLAGLDADGLYSLS